MSLSRLATLSCLLVAATTAEAHAQASPAKIERFLDHCETSRRGAILRLEHKLRGLRRQTPATPETKEGIARLEKQLRILRSNAKPVVPPLAFPPQIGAIGRLPGLTCHVEQVISDDELLVQCFFPVVVRTVKNFTPRRETIVQSMRFLIRGRPTQGVHEGSDLEMLDVFEVAGKHGYKTVDGASERVLVLTRFDMKAVEPYFRRMVEKNR